jgi:hypothetical protein
VWLRDGARGGNLVVACEAEGGDDDVGDTVGGVEDVDRVGETGEIMDGGVAQCPYAVSMPNGF